MKQFPLRPNGGPWAVFAALCVLAPPAAIAASSLPDEVWAKLPPHPRLFARPEKWAALKTQVTTDAVSQRMFALIRERAENSDKPTKPGVAHGKFGTIDVSGSAESSGGLLLILDHGVQPGWSYGAAGYVGPSETAGKAPLASAVWSARLRSGPLAVQNTETDLGKLTVSFSLAVTRALPIRVVVESFNGKQERTGGVETTIYPAAADFYQRYALDLSALKPAGGGRFNPTAPFVGFTVVAGSAEGWPAATHHELRLDNVHYATPAYYVSPNGSDARDGRSEQTARIVRLNNLYWGGAQPNIPGIADLVADPLFMNPGTDPATADFRLKPTSPARQPGRWELFTPSTDLDGHPRPTHAAPALGAYQS